MEKITKKKLVEGLDNAFDIITNGWCKHASFLDKDGKPCSKEQAKSMCMGSAMDESIPVYFQNHLMKKIGVIATSYPSVIDFNDSEATSKGDVLAALSKMKEYVQNNTLSTIYS